MNATNGGGGVTPVPATRRDEEDDVSDALDAAEAAIGDLAESDADEAITNREYAVAAVRAYLDALDADAVEDRARAGGEVVDRTQCRIVLAAVRP